MTKICMVGAILMLAAACASQPHRVDERPSQPLVATGPGPGWTTVTLAALAKTSRANCMAESARLIRCSGRLQIAGLRNTTVQGEGKEIQFTGVGAGKGGLELDNANNVVLANLTLSWLGGGARDPIVPGAQRIQSFGNVTSCPGAVPGGVLKLDLPLDGMQAVATASVWDDKQGWPWYPGAPERFEVYFAAGAAAKFSNGQTGCLPQLAAVVGHRVLLRHIISSNPAFLCWGCQNVTVNRVRVMSAPGMAFVFGNGGSNFSLIGDVVAPRCAPGCPLPEPSTTADAAHFSNIGGNILLEHNDFGWQGDDGLNITGLLIPATLASDQGTHMRRLNVDAAWRGRLNLMTVGSSVSLFDTGLAARGEAKVTAVDTANGTLELSSVPGNMSDFIITRTAGIPTNVVVRDNQFHDNRARGILMGASNALIQANSIQRVSMEAIILGADTGPWYEGPGPKHVKIEGNTISDVNQNPAPTYPSAISAGVSIKPGYMGVVGSPIEDIVIENNSLKNVYKNVAETISMGAGSVSSTAKTSIDR